jgi:hypothetical protein
VDPGKKGGVSFMGSVCGDVGSPFGHGNPRQSALRVSGGTGSYRSAQVMPPFPGPAMKKQQATMNREGEAK